MRSRPASTLAIVNPTHVRPVYEISEQERELADDLIFDRRPDALARCIAHFEQTEAVTAQQEDPFEGLGTDRAPPREDPAPHAARGSRTTSTWRSTSAAGATTTTPSTC